MKVSIVLPTYNGSHYIDDAIESILNQTYNDWELIIVDDCSTDETLLKIREYEKKDDRIHVVHNNSNVKLPRALNIGFKYTSGEYLTWTSDDNIYLSTAIEQMVKYLEYHKEYEMVCAGMLVADENKCIIREHPMYSRKRMFIDDMVGACFMYRRTVYTNIGEYDPDLFCVEDFEYWVRILESGGSIGYIPACLYVYRVHNESLSISKGDLVKKQRSRHYIKHLDWILEGIKDDSQTVLWLYDYLLTNAEGSQYSNIKKVFQTYFQVIQLDTTLPSDCKFVLYGAGTVGDLAFDILGDRVNYFTDKNNQLVGTMKHGKPVISVLEACNLVNTNDNLHMVISVGADKQLEVMVLLASKGVKNFSVYANIKKYGMNDTNEDDK